MKLNYSAAMGSALFLAGGLSFWASACSGATSGTGTDGGSGGSTSSGGSSSSSGGGSTSGSGSGSTSSSGGSTSGGSSSSGSSSGTGSSSNGSSSSGGASSSSSGSSSGAKDGGSAMDASCPTDAAPAPTDAGAYGRTGWTAVAMPDHVAANMTNPPSTESLATSNAFDGNRSTRWATGVYQSTLTFPLYFTANMQTVQTVSKITLFSGTQDQNDYPYMMDVLFSTDGTTFTPVVTNHAQAAPTTANAGIDTILIPACAGPTQYIQLKATMARTTANSPGNYWWAIGEMNVYP